MPDLDEQLHAAAANEVRWILATHCQAEREARYRAREYRQCARACWQIDNPEAARTYAVTARLMRRLARSLRRR